jgi:hypothetical protein
VAARNGKVGSDVPGANPFLIALEVLANLDVGVFLSAAFIFTDKLEIRRQDPTAS